MSEVVSMPTIYPVACHTDYVGAGSTFVAIKGHKQDGIDHIPLALHKGASKIVVQSDGLIPKDTLSMIMQARAELVIVDNARAALADYAAAAADYPAKKLKIYAITGTKGKTTSAFLLAHVLKAAGLRVALLSTVKNSILDQDFPATLTTAHPDYLHQFLALCVNAGVTHVVMEVAAQAHTLSRVHGIAFDGFIFTNFSAEHAEFYATMDDYFAAKAALLDQVRPGAPVCINADDARCASLLLASASILSFGMHTPLVHSRGRMHDASLDALTCLVTDGQETHTYVCPALLGTFNGYNMLGVIALARAIGLQPAAIAAALHSFTPVPGRFESRRLSNGALSIIDYAHNPSSYEAVLSLVRALTKQLIVVFGCGGERDHAKRPVMGAIAATHADIIILTTDNPRTEDPELIIDAIEAGIDDALRQKCQVIRVLDREAAIRMAYTLSHKDSIIMLLGKGPERYQQIGSQKHYFNESAIVASL